MKNKKNDKLEIILQGDENGLTVSELAQLGREAHNLASACTVIAFHLGFHKRKLEREGIILHYDTILQIAKAFCEKYPATFNWEEFYEKGGDCWDVTCEEFADQYIKDNDIPVDTEYYDTDKNGDNDLTPEVVYFEKPQTPECQWVVAFDTLCTGWDAVKNDKDQICLFEDHEADQEVSEDAENLFKVHIDDYVHGRKTIINSIKDGKVDGSITGIKPIKQ